MSGEPKGRILVLFGSIPLYGHERGNIDTMEALREKGWDVLFVTHPEWGHQAVQPELDRRGFRWTVATFAERFDRGIGLRGWWRRLRDIFRGSRELRRILREYRPTRIHLGNPTWFVDFLPVLLVTRIPIVYRLGDKPASHRRAFRVLWRHLIGPRTARFVCISEFVRRELAHLAEVEGKSTVIYSRPPARSGAETPRRLPELREGFRFVYVGQITEEKGVGIAVDAALRVLSDYPAAQFLFAGDHSWNNPFARIQIDRVQSAGAGDSIRFLGYLEDAPALLRECEVHLCPSLCPEALGATVLEAKAQGLPSIVFPSGGLSEIVQDGADGVVCESSTVDALAKAMAEYAADPVRARSHGEAARESLKRLGIEKFAERWDAVYREAGRE